MATDRLKTNDSRVARFRQNQETQKTTTTATHCDSDKRIHFLATFLIEKLIGKYFLLLHLFWFNLLVILALLVHFQDVFFARDSNPKLFPVYFRFVRSTSDRKLRPDAIFSSRPTPSSANSASTQGSENSVQILFKQ